MCDRTTLSAAAAWLVVGACCSLAAAYEGLSRKTLLAVAKHLVHKRFEQFQAGLRDHLAGPGGDALDGKGSYEMAMQEVLSQLESEFVVVQSAVGDHLLIPQCRCVHERALLIEYRVVPPRRLASAALAEALWREAQGGRDEIGRRGYPAFPAGFHHVKEIVKIGISFYRRNWTALSYETEFVNGGTTGDDAYR